MGASTRSPAAFGSASAGRARTAVGRLLSGWSAAGTTAKRAADPDPLPVSLPGSLNRHGEGPRDTQGEPSITNRSGQSTALVMPIRGVAITAGGRPPARGPPPRRPHRRPSWSRVMRQRLAELPGPRAELPVGDAAATLAHDGETLHRLERPQQDRTRLPAPADQVGAPVHTVGEVDVPRAGRAEQRLVLGVPPMPVAMRRGVLIAEVGFGLDDPPGRPRPAERRDHGRAQQLRGRPPPPAGRKTRRAASLPVGFRSLGLLLRSRSSSLWARRRGVVTLGRDRRGGRGRGRLLPRARGRTGFRGAGLGLFGGASTHADRFPPGRPSARRR